MAQSARTAPFPAPRSSRKLTYEEFLDWPGENQHIEWVDGEVIEMSPVFGKARRYCTFSWRTLAFLC